MEDMTERNRKEEEDEIQFLAGHSKKSWKYIFLLLADSSPL
jgi:hypothetical protein